MAFQDKISDLTNYINSLGIYSRFGGLCIHTIEEGTPVGINPSVKDKKANTYSLDTRELCEGYMYIEKLSKGTKVGATNDVYVSIAINVFSAPEQNGYLTPAYLRVMALYQKISKRYKNDDVNIRLLEKNSKYNGYEFAQITIGFNFLINCDSPEFDEVINCYNLNYGECEPVPPTQPTPTNKCIKSVFDDKTPVLGGKLDASEGIGDLPDPIENGDAVPYGWLMDNCCNGGGDSRKMIFIESDGNNIVLVGNTTGEIMSIAGSDIVCTSNANYFDDKFILLSAFDQLTSWYSGYTAYRISGNTIITSGWATGIPSKVLIELIAIPRP